MDEIVLEFACYAPEALAAYVPPSARRVLDCSWEGPARVEAIRQRSDAEITGLSRESDADAEAAFDHYEFGALDQTLARLSPASFDCIICDDILPDQRDPLPVLTQLAGLLDPAGLMVLTFPNLQYHQTLTMLALGHWKQTRHGVMARRHLKFFTAVEIRDLLREAALPRAALHGLVKDDPATFPRDEDGYVRQGRLAIGPLSDEEHRRYLIQHYLVLAQKTAIAS